MWSPRVENLCHIVHYYTLCTFWSCILDMSCIIHPLYYTTCARISSQLGFSMTIKWSWSCLKSISQNEWVAQPLKIAYDSGKEFLPGWFSTYFLRSIWDLRIFIFADFDLCLFLTSSCVCYSHCCTIFSLNCFFFLSQHRFQGPV